MTLQLLQSANDEYHKCYSVGNNHFGSQATRNTDHVNKLSPMTTLPPNMRINNIVYGSNGSCYIQFNNTSLIVVGYNGYGQLGLGFEITKILIYYFCGWKIIPMDIVWSIIKFVDKLIYAQDILKPFQIYDMNAKYISNGITAYHRFIINDKDQLFGVGWNLYKQLSISDRIVSTNTWMKIDYFSNLKLQIKTIDCSLRYTTFLTTNGEVFACGTSYCGAMAQYSRMKQLPQIQRLVAIRAKIMDIACGFEFTLALSVDQKVYSFGDNTHGQLGHGTTDKIYGCMLIKYFEQNKLEITKIKAGSSHCVVLDKSGKVISFISTFVFKEKHVLYAHRSILLEEIMLDNVDVCIQKTYVYQN